MTDFTKPIMIPTSQGEVDLAPFNNTQIPTIVSQLAENTQLLPINIMKYGASADGITDCLNAFNSVIANMTNDISNRLINTTLTTDIDSNGIADGWTIYTDPGITGSSANITDGQQLNVLASTGAGNKSIYQDFAVTPGESIAFGVIYKSIVNNGTFYPYLDIWATGGTKITAFYLPNSLDYITYKTGYIVIPAGVTSIRLYFCARSKASGDVGSVTFKNVTLTTPQNIIKPIIKFPQNSTNNAVYYFSQNPDISNKHIDADNGVILSFPSTNGLSFKTVIFHNDIDIISRDRNNTGHQFCNSYSKFIYTALNKDDNIGHLKPSEISSPIYKYSLITNSIVVTDISSNLIKYLSNTDFYQVDNTSLTSNAGNIIGTLTDVLNGDMLSSAFMFLIPETNSTARYGAIIQNDVKNQFVYISMDISKKVYIGYNNNGIWTETSVDMSTKLTDAYSSAYAVILSVRIANNVIEFYVNGVKLASYTATFNITRMGFGINCVIGANQGINNILWSDIYKESIQKSSIGDTLSLIGFGDSITFGEGAISWFEFMPQLLEGNRGIQKVYTNNQAISGDNIAHQLSLMQGMDLSSYNAILIMIGTNDIQSGLDYSTFKTNLLAMITAANGKPVIIGYPPMFISQALTGSGYADSNYNKGGLIRGLVLRLCAENSNVYLADTLSSLGRIGVDNQLLMLRDNLHPTVYGQLIIAKCFSKCVVKALCKDVEPIINIINGVIQAPTLLNSWINYGGNYSSAGYYKDASGIVHLQGLIKGGTVTSGTILFNLAQGYRPSAYQIFSLKTSTATPAGVEIHTNGDVATAGQFDAVYTSLSGISFSTQ